VPPTASEPTRNLVLVHTKGWQDVADFQTIKAHVEEMAPDIEVFIVSNDIRSSVTRRRAAKRPTLVFSPLMLVAFKPDRGKVYAGQPMSKLTEMRRLADAGMPVPQFEEIRPETILSTDVYGPYVVVKPTYKLASWGQGVELRHTAHVRYRPPSEYPADHPGRRGPMVAQKFGAKEAQAPEPVEDFKNLSRQLMTKDPDTPLPAHRRVMSSHPAVVRPFRISDKLRCDVPPGLSGIQNGAPLSHESGGGSLLSIRFI
jgi:hypothetical protein